MPLKVIVDNELFLFIILLAASAVSYFQFTFSELKKEKKGEKDILTPLRWIIFCFIIGLLLLWVMPVLLLISMFSHSTTKDLSLFFTLSFSHIIVVGLFLILGTLPVYWAKRRKVRNRTLFRILEFGFMLYLTVIATFGLLGEIRASFVSPFEWVPENGWGVIEVFAIMVLLFSGGTVVILRMGKNILASWARDIEDKEN